MNKAELIMKVSEKANVTQKVAKVIVDTLFDGMKESLEKEKTNYSRVEKVVLQVKEVQRRYWKGL